MTQATGIYTNVANEEGRWTLDCCTSVARHMKSERAGDADRVSREPCCLRSVARGVKMSG